ncbi:farnesol dehydrogenase-like [Hyposmocoma kahamanoa]|uniref:farnesol dehydrogenase-like n=1 Tax=Hyposmocoma kahamanoa TaxID=1477025 RepID=UPI000E6D6F66|nr:farnesol dehydrogenase-like [Hyposmocoma kahamanoa]XP_026333159.1 farnesol dehydrogenase-like [Hyposmocoma kahamanoa]XP_026333160.1 farnesol dehydrogenase-like [Hyposmocoma kahamanoa]
MERWACKTAVVTGASSGIGAAICVSLANAGLNVLGLARRTELIDKLKAEVKGKGSIHSHKCDVAKLADIEAAFKWAEENLDGVHVMVNNAGVMTPGNITELGGPAVSDETIITTVNVNLTGLVLCTRRAINLMKKYQVDGHIINVDSLAGHYIPFVPGFNIYPGTKYGVRAFSGTLVNELAQLKSKIKVTNLSPGLVRTEMAVEATKAVDFMPLEPQDIADAVLYAVATPPNVNITELTIQPVNEKRL